MNSKAIGIDGIAFSHPQPGGYRTYTRYLVKALMELETPYKFWLFVHQSVSVQLPAQWQIEIVPVSLPFVGVAWREQISIPQYIARTHLSLIHSPCSTGPLRSTSPHLITLHDAIEFSIPLFPIPNLRGLAMRLYNRAIQAQLARTASHFITPSHYAKTQLTKILGVPTEQITVIYHGVDHQRFRPNTPLAKPKPRRGMILALASPSTRKNIPHLLSCYARLPTDLRKRFRLTLVGTPPLFQKRLAHLAHQLGIEEHLQCMGMVQDEILAELYRQAGLFLFPSLDEGFGLPPLEAMASGTPVIASYGSCLPEVLGEAAWLVSPMDVRGWAEAMETLLTQPTTTYSFVERGLQHSQQFQWRQTALETVGVYQRLLS